MKTYSEFIGKIVELPDLIDHYGRVTNIRKLGEILEIEFRWVLNIGEKQLVLKKGPFVREYTFGIPLQYFLAGKSRMLRFLEDTFDKFDHNENI